MTLIKAFLWETLPAPTFIISTAFREDFCLWSCLDILNILGQLPQAITFICATDNVSICRIRLRLQICILSWKIAGDSFGQRSRESIKMRVRSAVGGLLRFNRAVRNAEKMLLTVNWCWWWWRQWRWSLWAILLLRFNKAKENAEIRVKKSPQICLLWLTAC